MTEAQEEKKILSDGERLTLMLEHEGWAIARSLLSERILELQMIGDIVSLSPEDMAIQVKAKKLAAEILYAFLTQDIEGTAAQHINNNIPPEKKNDYILREQ